MVLLSIPWALKGDISCGDDREDKKCPLACELRPHVAGLYIDVRHVGNNDS